MTNAQVECSTFELSINHKNKNMKSYIFTLLGVFIFFASGLSQVDKFKFEIDGEQYLRIRKNDGGFNIIHQHNNQSSMFFGFNSGLNTIDDPMTFSSGDNNTTYGFNTLSANTTGFQNTAIGSGAMTDNISGSSSVGIGFGALYKGTTAFLNVGIGKSALYSNLTGSFNVAIGGDAFNTTNNAERSVAIGYTAAVNDTSSVDNVYVGFGTGRGTVFATDGYDRLENVMVGSYAGYYNQTNGNVFLGHRAGMNAKADNQLYITNDDTDSLNTLIYGQFDNELVRINGDLNIDGLYTFPNTAPGVKQYLGYNGGTNLTWGTIDDVWSYGAGNDAVYDDGDVGVGIANPMFQLDVEDDVFNGYITRFHNTNTASNSKGIIIRAGITSNPASGTYYALFRDGSGTDIGGIRGNGAGGVIYSSVSDKRLKQNIKTFDKGLATLEKINPAIYQMKSNPNQDEIGFIAQELQKVLPLVVGGNPTDDAEESPMTVDYGRITPVLVAAIKEQQEIIKTLTERLDSQDKQFSELKVQIAKIQGLAQQ
ncbi:MAG: hypothetical protein ACJATI_003634 [Halioglobus sp.]